MVESGGRRVRVRALGGSRAGEIRLTRFLRNPAVSVDEMLDEARLRTASRVAGRHILAIQDTTVTRSDGGGGDYLHACIAVDCEDDALLGLIDAQFLSRGSGKRAQRKDLPVEDKESQRWLDGAVQAGEVCATAARVTVMGDRESDIFELFASCPANVDLLVRAGQDRRLADDQHLFAAADALPVAGHADLDLPAKPGHRARTAKLALRFAKVELSRPRTVACRGLPERVAVTLVDVRESNPPPGAPPIHWRLVTTHDVSTLADGWFVVGLYRRRWAIEQLFRTLKAKGFDIEALRIDDNAPRNKLIMATLIAAIAIQQLVHARDGAKEGAQKPLRPLIDAFEPEDQNLIEALCASLEGKTERQKNPHPKASLAYAAWVCARLGGWTGYYGKPGPIVMFEGWLQFQAAKKGVALITASKDV